MQIRLMSPTLPSLPLDVTTDVATVTSGRRRRARIVVTPDRGRVRDATDVKLLNLVAGTAPACDQQRRQISPKPPRSRRI